MLSNVSIASVYGKAIEPAGATGVDQRLLGASLAQMRSIPRDVRAARPVAVAEHGARAIRRNIRVLLREGHGVRGPVVAGVIVSVDECPAIGIRTGQDVVLIAAGRRSHTGNLVAF